MELPLTKLPALTQDPKNLIIYGLPKVGKTTLLSQLDSCLIVDFEDGTDYVDALKVKVTNSKELTELCKAIKSPAGSAYEGDILTAPMGIGYSYVKEAVLKIITMVASVTDNLILVGHVKDKSIVSAQGSEIGNIKDFDLTGKLGRILASKSDAIGFIYRDEESNLCINFETNGEATAGARPIHLANKKIIVAERKQDGTFENHWERIYPSLEK